DQLDNAFTGMLFENTHRHFRHSSGFVSVANTIDHRDKDAAVQRFDQVHVAGDGLSGNRARGDAPINYFAGGNVAQAKLMQPFFHGDDSTLANFGFDVELVHQPFGTGQPNSQAFAGGEAILHGLTHVRDSGPLILGDDRQAAPVAPMDQPQDHPAAFGVFDDVAGNFRNGRGDAGEVGTLEAEFDRQATALLTRGDDVRRGGNINSRFAFHGFDFSWPSGPGRPV